MASVKITPTGYTTKFLMFVKWFGDPICVETFNTREDVLKAVEQAATEMNSGPIDQSDRNEGAVFMEWDTDPETGEPIRPAGITDGEWDSAEQTATSWGYEQMTRMYDCEGIMAYVRVMEVSM